MGHTVHFDGMWRTWLTAKKFGFVICKYTLCIENEILLLTTSHSHVLFHGNRFKTSI